jgi:NADH-quinone oxidoreductase subunit C
MSETTTEESIAEAASEETASDELREGLLATITEALGDKVVGSHVDPGLHLWVRVDRSAWVETAELVKAKLGCTFFDFLSAIDWMPSPWGRYEYSAVDLEDGIPKPDPSAPITTGVAGGDTRFQVLTRLSNVHKHYSVFLKADLPDDDLSIATLVPTFAGASWHERECWEMFGITFDGHPSLRHIYLPGAFEGHPLRKDFPLLARLVKPWPGIVDVEPMPDEPGEEGEGDAEGEGEEPSSNGEGGGD